MIFDIFPFTLPFTSNLPSTSESSSMTIHGIASNLSTVSSYGKVIPNSMMTNILQLSILTGKLELIAPKYDRPGFKKANGFRSIVKVINKFVPTLLEITQITQMDSPANIQRFISASKENNFPSKCVNAANSVLTILIELCDMAIDCHNNWSLVKDTKQKFLWLQRTYRYTHDRLSTHLQQYWAYHPVFWYESTIRKLLTLTTCTFAALSKPPNSLTALLSNEERGERLTSIVWKGDPFYQTGIINLVDNPLTSSISRLFLKYHKITAKNINIKRQKNWFIPSDGGSVTRVHDISSLRDGPLRDTVKLRLYQADSVTASGTVIIQIQGGGFMVDAHTVHTSYLKSWLPQLAGAIVLNIDYSLNVRYPVALQEIVDTLLWLTSPKTLNDVASTLQIIPTSIVILGDSCGGYLGLASCAVLRDIQDLAPDEITILPESIVCISPVMAPVNLNYSPSLLLSILDPFLCPAINLQVLSLYSSGITLDSECHSTLDATTSSSQAPMSSGYVEESLWFTINRCMFNKYPCWFDCDPVVFEKRLIKMTDKLFSPYISILTSYDLTRLSSDLRIHLITSELDVQLDSAFEFERVWEGKITIDVVEDLPHGFYAFAPFSNAAKIASQVCLDRLKQAIGLQAQSTECDINF
ncbi:uncharacterized protein LOC107370828 [Tetranychus urticae]|uniref:Alpha/beta hydrolase fold-3 domain-containing protein n=1 Tax=Tetranychus urticae TaxID=32264 RepID=T1JXM9_TETUR|nr:uncharacterized protein LOC107370828 [Tetranychus urticae]